MSNLSNRAWQQDPLARFRHKIAENAQAWLGFVHEHRPESAVLTRELANLDRAVNQALSEPTAWQDGLRLAIALWPLIDWHGYWLAWRPVLDRALVVCRRLADLRAEVDITDQLGELARNLGAYRDALTWQERALALAREQGDHAVVGRVLVHLSQQYLPQGRYQAAKACCEEAISLLEPLDAAAEVAVAYNNWGIACSDEGLLEPALAHLTRAAAMFEAQSNRRGQAKALHNQGEVRRRQERLTEAGALYERAIALALEAGDEVGAMRSRSCHVILLHQQGQHTAALAPNLELKRGYRRLGDRAMLARVLNNEGSFLQALRRWDEAALAYEEAAQIHLEIGNLTDAALSLLNWAELLLDRGDTEQALLRLQQSEKLTAALPDPPALLRQFHAELSARAAVERSNG